MQGENTMVWVVTHLGRERVVAHDFASTSLWIPVCAISSSRSFEEMRCSYTTLLGPSVVPVDIVQMKPCFMMATLTIWSQAECFPWDGECTMYIHCPKRWEPGGLRNPQTSAQLSGMDPSPHSGVQPGGVGKAQSVKASSTVLRLFLLRQRHGVPLKSPATKSTCWEIMIHEEWEWASWRCLSFWRKCCWYEERALQSTSARSLVIDEMRQVKENLAWPIPVPLPWFDRVTLVLLELVIIQTRTRNFVQLIHFLICQITVPLDAFLSMSLRSWDEATVCAWGFCLTDIRDSNIFVYCSMIVSFGLHSRWVHPKQRNEVGSSRTTFCINFFHMGSKFCCFPAFLQSST